MKQKHDLETEALLSALSDCQRMTKTLQEENPDLRDRIRELEDELDEMRVQIHWFAQACCHRARRRRRLVLVPDRCQCRSRGPTRSDGVVALIDGGAMSTGDSPLVLTHTHELTRSRSRFPVVAHGDPLPWGLASTGASGRGPRVATEHVVVSARRNHA